MIPTQIPTFMKRVSCHTSGCNSQSTSETPLKYNNWHNYLKKTKTF